MSGWIVEKTGSWTDVGVAARATLEPPRTRAKTTEDSILICRRDWSMRRYELKTQLVSSKKKFEQAWGSSRSFIVCSELSLSPIHRPMEGQSKKRMRIAFKGSSTG
jgi:hypothetical protein